MLTVYPIESKGEKLSDFDKETAGRAPSGTVPEEQLLEERMEESERTGIY